MPPLYFSRRHALGLHITTTEGLIRKYAVSSHDFCKSHDQHSDFFDNKGE